MKPARLRERGVMSVPATSVLRVVAFWRAAPGRREMVLEILRELAAKTQQEPGCLGFEVLEDVTQPDGFVLLERYADVRARDEHLASTHFRELVLQRAVPMLSHRDVQTHTVLVPDTAAGGQGESGVAVAPGEETRPDTQP
jgi:quinol monooxygenase YgiN